VYNELKVNLGMNASQLKTCILTYTWLKKYWTIFKIMTSHI